MRKLIVFIMLILASLLILVGCNDIFQGNHELDSGHLEIFNSEENNQEYSSLFNKINNIDQYSYILETRLEDDSIFNSKIIASGPKTRIETQDSETGEDIIMVQDKEEEVSYIYTPRSNQAIKMNYSPLQYNSNDQEEVKDYFHIVKKIINKEDISMEDGNFQGKPVGIITEEVFASTNTIWISKETGFPIKSEVHIDNELNTSSIFRNFKSEDINDSIFILPEDVQIIDMTKT